MSEIDLSALDKCPDCKAVRDGCGQMGHAAGCRVYSDWLKEQPKPASVQSAELSNDQLDEYAYDFWLSTDRGHDDRTRDKIRSAFAAQRQAGREEVRESYDLACKIFGERYAAVVEAAKRVIAICPTHAELRKALRELGEEQPHAKD